MLRGAKTRVNLPNPTQTADYSRMAALASFSFDRRWGGYCPRHIEFLLRTTGQAPHTPEIPPEGARQVGDHQQLVAGLRPAWGRKMLAVLDPEEIVVLANHGVMKLRSAVARAMALLPEDRDAAIIVRKGELSQSILGFEQIKQLAERWEQADAGCSLR
jgi:hypothetical protein